MHSYSEIIDTMTRIIHKIARFSLKSFLKRQRNWLSTEQKTAKPPKCGNKNNKKLKILHYSEIIDTVLSPYSLYSEYHLRKTPFLVIRKNAIKSLQRHSESKRPQCTPDADLRGNRPLESFLRHERGVIHSPSLHF